MDLSVSKYREVVESLVNALQDLDLDKHQPDWMVSCSDNDLREHGSYEPGPDDLIRGEQDWGNNAGSVLVILMIRCGLKCCTDELNFQTTRFAQSSKGPDNRRTNYVECLLGEWKDTPARHQVRELLKHAWRLCFVALSVSWKKEHSNCHELAEAVLTVRRACCLEDLSATGRRTSTTTCVIRGRISIIAR